ncbi:MAG: N-acetyl-1-D-myo-inositol-2-amino-2-deoxy-alpha-D-glucopyranoside deacetylase [Mycobacteriales bacterium]
MTADRRLLLVHAHPDDESIATGATMARYAAEGVHVCLVTCTRGEEGEVVADELRHLAGDPDGGLGPHRVGELAAACAELGVGDHRFLGGAGRWRDSGMMGSPANDHPGCFWRADLSAASAALVAVIREVQPQVVVTYDELGDYGHPDHIQANRVAGRAVARAADPSFSAELGVAWVVGRLYYTARAGAAQPSVTCLDGSAYLMAKRAAMAAHRTQLTLFDGEFALADGVRHEIGAVECFWLARGAGGPAESDLFAGL